MIPTARIATLIPSLSRQNDNEVLATVRAIGAALRSAGADFHDLAAAIRGQDIDRPSPEPSRPTSASWAPGHRARQANSDRDRATWLAMYGASALSDWEKSFVDSLVRQLGRRGSTASAKQAARLGQIFSRVSRAAA